jgi:hypothetical protein
MGIGVTNQQTTLKKQQAGIPNRRAATEQWQNHLRNHWFNNEQQCRVQEQS